MTTLFRLFLGAQLVLFFTQSAHVALACPVIYPDDEVIVSVSLPSVGKADVLLQWYGDEVGGSCSAQLDLPIQRLASLRFIPRLEDIAEPIGLIAQKLWSANRCNATVFVYPQARGLDDWEEFHCTFGTISLDKGNWIVSHEDSDC